VCNRHTLVRGSRVFELVAEGELPLLLGSVEQPMDLEALGGEVFELPAKVDEFDLRPGDVLQYTWAGGGGYGDPRARDSERIEDDLDHGVISEEKAARVYQPPRPLTDAPGTPVGLHMRLADGRLRCECGHAFGGAGDNWKDAAVARLCDPPPPGIRVHDSLELVEWRCPECERLHCVEVKEKGSPPIQDFCLR
jgi:N-methylhydantoinase B